MIGLPTSARPSERAVRKMVSPSGMDYCTSTLARVVMRHGQRNPPQVHAERAGMKAGVHEKAGHEVRGDGLPVDGGDQHALVAAAPCMRSCPRAQRKCARPAAACERSGSSAGRKTRRLGLLRRSHATSWPLRRITSA